MYMYQNILIDVIKFELKFKKEYIHIKLYMRNENIIRIDTLVSVHKFKRSRKN